MSFNIGGIAIDHIVMGTMETAAGELAYTLSQLSDASVSITSESKDITDAQGTLVRRVFRSKTGEFSSTNAFIDLNVVASASGTNLVKASSEAKLTVPYIATVGKAETEHSAAGIIAAKTTVIGINGSGAEVERYELDTAAAEKKFAVAEGKVTLPTGAAAEVVNYVIKSERSVEDGMKVVNAADKFPKAGVLTLKALAIDPCDKEGLIACYIKCPNFVPNPDMELSLANDGDNTIAYNGTLAADYCAADKTLVEVYLCDDGE